MPLGRNCEVGKKFVRIGSHCAPGKNLHVGKKMDRAGSNCTTREEIERR